MTDKHSSPMTAVAAEFERLRTGYKNGWLVSDTEAFERFCFKNSDVISAALQASAPATPSGDVGEIEPDKLDLPRYPSNEARNIASSALDDLAGEPRSEDRSYYLARWIDAAMAAKAAQSSAENAEAILDRNESNRLAADNFKRALAAEAEVADLTKANALLHRFLDIERARLAEAVEILRWLDRLGGLGYQKHDRIQAFLNGPVGGLRE